MPAHQSVALKKFAQKRAIALKQARHSFIRAISEVKPTPEAEERNKEAGKLAARAQKAEFLNQYRAVAKSDSQ